MEKLIKALLLITATSLFLGFITQPYWSQATQEVVVNKTERVEGVYLIYTDKGVFRNEDSWHYFKFDSSDLYSDLKEGESYTCKSYGFRVSFFSMYPNVVSCK